MSGPPVVVRLRRLKVMTRAEVDAKVAELRELAARRFRMTGAEARALVDAYEHREEWKRIRTGHRGADCKGC